ncbi:hypothetical protein BV22DRAFT_893728 [Leucogyrophana mollusca]|uniref:Uncharacterized protein n=1 Tax=Leucogyrophana mollusca TaxID=85980 RepID=A0ACB8B034_9AGAM|nr:hypothetical protein BV22DRAFT_893728 [Leucogyrophana mollusca]
MTSVFSIPSASNSVIRRKPKVTYQSPSAHSPPPSTEQSVTLHSTGGTYSTHGSSSSSSPQPITTSAVTLTAAFATRPYKKRIKSTMGPPLPLYHPLGRLALSLPELDPTTLGLPASISIVEDPTRRSSNRARRPAAKVRDVEETVASQLPFIDVTPALGQEPKDAPSPRKRRGGTGGGGGGNKRKRKEPDDGDASYPAKRSRNPRGVAAPTAVARTSASEAVSPPQSIGHTAGSPSVAATDGPVEAQDEKRPERRATRSRAPVSRRDSTASEATVTSVSVSIAATTAPVRNSGNKNEMEMDGSAPELEEDNLATPTRIS